MPATRRTPVPLTPDEQRRSRRPRVLLSGRLVYGEAGLTVDCAIRDRTESGARLKLSGSAMLPAKVTLIEIASGMMHDCEISWRRLPEVGVSFLSSRPLQEESGPDPELLKLRRMWRNAQAR